MTKTEAIKKAIKLWKKLAESGKHKMAHPELTCQYEHGCPLCQYAMERNHKDSIGALDKSCMTYCPYYIHFHRACSEVGSNFRTWSLSSSTASKKTYAAKFVKELEQLLPKKGGVMATSTKLVATAKDVERRCCLEDTTDCSSDGDFSEVTLNGNTIVVCEDCYALVGDILGKFGIEVKYTYS